MARFIHHWLIFGGVLIVGQYYINMTTFTALEFGYSFELEARVNPLIPESIVVG